MKHSVEPPRLLRDKGSDPVARQLLRAGYGDGPTEQRLRAAPSAIAALLGTHAITGSALGSVATASRQAVSVATSATSAAIATVATLSATAGSTTGAMVTLPLFAKAVLVGLAVGGSLIASIPNVSPSQPAPSLRAVPSVSASTRVPARTTTLAPATPVAIANAPPQPPAITAEGVKYETLGLKPLSAAPRLREPARHSAVNDETTEGDPGRSLNTPEEHALLRRGDVGGEVRLLDSARNALEQGDLSRALRALGEHSALTHKTLEPEATVLHVRALLAGQRNQEAARLAEAFAFRAPNAQQNLVIRRML